MKYLLIFAFIVLSPFCKAQSAENTVLDFFEALNQKDIQTLENLTSDELSLHSLSVLDIKKLTTETKSDFLASIKELPKEFKIEERISDLKSLNSDFITQFLMSYEFYVNDKFSHSGHNAITLIKIDGSWVIVSIVDTRKRK